MDRNHRNSQLQKEIVALLKHEPNLKMAEIAERVNRHYTSVTRSIRVLKQRGLIAEKDGLYRLKKAKESQKIFEDSLVNTEYVKLLKRISNFQIPTISQKIFEDFTLQKESLNAFSAIKLESEAITKAWGDLVGIQNYVTPIIDYQQQLAKAVLPMIEMSNQISEFSKAITIPYQNYLSEISRNIEFPLASFGAEIARSASILAEAKILTMDITPIFTNFSCLTKIQNNMAEDLKLGLLNSTKAFSSFLKESTIELNISKFNIFDASMSYSAGVTSLAYLVESSETEEITLQSPTLIQEDRIDDLLMRVDTSLVKTRKGAWYVFESDSPDKNRQAAHSMRELLRLVLTNLAPQEKERKAKLRAILHSKTEADLISSLADLVDLMYSRLSAFSHSDNHRELSVEFNLATAQNIVAYILNTVFNEESSEKNE